MIIRISLPFANDHLEFFLSTKFFSIFFQQIFSSKKHHLPLLLQILGSRFNLADLSRIRCSCFMESNSLMNMLNIIDHKFASSIIGTCWQVAAAKVCHIQSCTMMHVYQNEKLADCLLFLSIIIHTYENSWHLGNIYFFCIRYLTLCTSDHGGFNWLAKIITILNYFIHNNTYFKFIFRFASIS